MTPLHTLAAAALMIAAVVAAPVTYDQRQDGEFNVRADVQNIVLLAVIPEKIISPSQILGFLKSAGGHGEQKNSIPEQDDDDFQDRSDTNVLEAFVEPGTPYHVEITGKSSHSDMQAEPDSAVPVVIPVENDRYVIDAERDAKVVEINGKRKEENRIRDETRITKKSAGEPLKLLGALEQCGPGRARDHEGICQEDAPIETDPEEPSVSIA